MCNIYLTSVFAVLVADKVVPSRAHASLPTSYLCFETTNSDGANRSSKHRNQLNLFDFFSINVRLKTLPGIRLAILYLELNGFGRVD